LQLLHPNWHCKVSVGAIFVMYLASHGIFSFVSSTVISHDLE